ncbi:MAG: DMT family transporter [Candidatus Nanopelagicales bacterium]|nr:DMT family transporter [Candidatus Nanopelagicales bacterium]
MTSIPAWARSHRTLATLALVAATAVWGATFVVVQDAVEQMPVLPFLWWRFALATAVLALVRPRAVLDLSAQQRRRGLVLGLLLGGGYVLQTFGLLHTSATVSGFITGMFVVFTPLIGWLVLGEPVARPVWFAVGLATLGLALISLRGFAIGFGELLTLGCAALFAGQIVGLSRWSTSRDAYGLTVLQLGVVALLCLLASPLQGGVALPPNPGVWAAVVFLALAATALAFLAQTWAQTHMTAPRAAIVLTLEPVFAGIFGVTLGGDELTARILAGGACIVAAMYVVELAPRLTRGAVAPEQARPG